MKKFKLIALLVFGAVGFAIAQPPPPHPGGSGNQGAPIAYYSLLFFSILASSVVCKYKVKR